MSKTRRKLVTMSALAAAGLSAARPTWPQAPAGIKRIGWITNQPFATSDLPAVFFEAMRERARSRARTSRLIPFTTTAVPSASPAWRPSWYSAAWT